MLSGFHPPRGGGTGSNRQKAKTWVQVNQEEHLPGDMQKFKFPEVWAGRMKRKMQLMQLKQINAAPAKKGGQDSNTVSIPIYPSSGLQ